MSMKWTLIVSITCNLHEYDISETKVELRPLLTRTNNINCETSIQPISTGKRDICSNFVSVNVLAACSGLYLAARTTHVTVPRRTGAEQNISHLSRGAEQSTSHLSSFQNSKLTVFTGSEI
jgi:hypothetical protein